MSAGLAATAGPPAKVRTTAVVADYVAGEVVVRFKSGIGRTGRAAVLRETGAERKRWLRLSGAELLRVPAGKSVEAAVRELEAQRDVLYAEPNFIYEASATPNDPLFADLWGLSQPNDHDIDAPEAWDLTTGSSAVKVAVVDTGVASGHPDLAPNMLPGYDFIDNDSDPLDFNGHGTHVAGTIGAQGNDAVGVAGVNWDVGIIPVRVLGPDGGTNETVTNGFVYAAQQGAKVVNASLGGGGFAQAMKDAIDLATNTLFVVAAGNDGQSNESVPTYPCNYTSANLICVAATNEDDLLADFSNYGSTAVDLAAPGTSILSTWPAYVELATEDFENPLGANWSAGGTAATWDRSTTAARGSFGGADSPIGLYANDANNWLRRVTPVSLAGRTGCQIAYDLRLATEYGYDYLYVETSTDGATW